MTQGVTQRQLIHYYFVLTQVDVVQLAGELGAFHLLAELSILDLYSYLLLHCPSRSRFGGAPCTDVAVVNDLFKRA